MRARVIYLFVTSLKSVSSMKLHRDLDIAQNSAWHLSHRIRAALRQEGTALAGPVRQPSALILRLNFR